MITSSTIATVTFSTHYTASRHLFFQQTPGAQHRLFENEHWPPSGIQVCCLALATEVSGVRKVPAVINTTPISFNNKVFFMYFSPMCVTSYLRSVQIKVDCYQCFLEYPVINAISPQRRRVSRGSAEGNRSISYTSAFPLRPLRLCGEMALIYRTIKQTTYSSEL
jgi:hypothetical protein